MSTFLRKFIQRQTDRHDLHIRRNILVREERLKRQLLTNFSNKHIHIKYSVKKTVPCCPMCCRVLSHSGVKVLQEDAFSKAPSLHTLYVLHATTHNLAMNSH
jgi:hypothetical protein